MKVEYPFWKLVFEGFKGTKIQKATVIAAFVLPMKGKFVLKVSVLIFELESSPNLKHYHSLIWNMKIEYPFWKLVFEGFKGTKIQKAAVIAAFVSPVKGEFVLKTSVLIVEFKPSPNLKHYPNLAERTGFEPVVPVTQYVSLANWWFQPLTHLSWPC